VIAEHLDKGKAYGNVPKVISISILYANIGKGDDYIYHGTTCFKGIHNKQIMELEEKEKEYYELNRVFNVFPEHYLIKLGKFNEITKDSLDEWIYFLKTATIKDNFTAKGIKKAQKSLDVLQLDTEERHAYEAHQEDLHYQASMFESSYGVGERKGMRKGRIEEKIEIAKNLLDILEIDVIAAKTGLSIEEVQALKNKQP
jgi:predicted transposase/invertase (TIGR01784 family)